MNLEQMVIRIHPFGRGTVVRVRERLAIVEEGKNQSPGPRWRAAHTIKVVVMKDCHSILVRNIGWRICLLASGLSAALSCSGCGRSAALNIKKSQGAPPVNDFPFPTSTPTPSPTPSVTPSPTPTPTPTPTSSPGIPVVNIAGPLGLPVDKPQPCVAVRGPMSDEIPNVNWVPMQAAVRFAAPLGMATLRLAGTLNIGSRTYARLWLRVLEVGVLNPDLTSVTLLPTPRLALDYTPVAALGSTSVGNFSQEFQEVYELRFSPLAVYEVRAYVWGQHASDGACSASDPVGRVKLIDLGLSVFNWR